VNRPDRTPPNGVRARRLQLRLSLARVGEKTGMDPSTVWRVEHGRVHAGRATQLLLATALRSRVDDLFPDGPEVEGT
jgi:transcriptional regulator with XRE-family HTH domain